MSTLSVGTIKSNTSAPPVIQNSSGVEIGELCRAWVNFNGTGTVAISESFNVSSITDNGVGDYTINFSTAMPDANYSSPVGVYGNTLSFTTSGFRIVTYTAGTGTQADRTGITVAVFR